MIIETRNVYTHDGWALELRRATVPEQLKPNRHPLLLVPGYGMNTFILSFHPRGASIERCLAEAGFEVWSVNMRGQGGARRLRGDARAPSLAVYADTDLPATIDEIIRSTRTKSDRVALIGCSLGGSIAYAHVGMDPGHRVSAIVAIGAPLRWEDPHAALRIAFGSPWVASRVRLTGTRAIARALLPVAVRIPGALNLYVNSRHLDRDSAAEMVQTVEDPQPLVNRDIAKWLRAGDMVLRGVNVTSAMQRTDLPLLIVLANRDGIVPAASVLSAERMWGGRDVQILRVGTDEDWYAHADLFISPDSPERVFAPIVRWLEPRVGASSSLAAAVR